MKFNARDNEYLGLHGLALRVQDLVLKGDGYNPRCPYMQLLEAIGIDAIRLHAICKAASARPAHVQLDYIQSRIAARLEMKLRVQGELQRVQALPHVSVFLGHFRKALSTVRERYENGVGSADLHAEIRLELAGRYPDPQAGLQAFDTAVGTFLEKKEKHRLPETALTGLLRGVVESSAQPANASDVNLDAVKWEVDRLVEALEQFRPPALHSLQSQP